MPKKIAIVGLGWLGLPLAKSFHARGYEVIGSTTRSEKLMRLLNSNLSVRIIKVSKNNLEGNWKNFMHEVDLLVINLPPGKNSHHTDHYPMQIKQIISRCEPHQKVIFVSSTSVYGNPNDQVTETSLTAPSKTSGVAVLAAEKLIQTYFGENATIVRMAGLMGEGRHPGRFLAEKNQLSNPEGKVNLIHQKDAIQLIQLIYEKDKFGEIYNGCSNEHPTREEFYTKAAYALSLNPPTFVPADKDDWKMVNNEKSKHDLGMIYTPIEDIFSF